MTPSAPGYVLAFDIGGTKIAAGVFDLSGRQLGELHRLPTMTHQKTVVTLNNLKRTGVEAQRAAGMSEPPAAIGVGSAGPLDAAAGILKNPDTLPNLVDFRVCAFLESEFGARAYLDNDAACFVLAEGLAGAGQGHDDVVGVTLGTGFGTGLFLGGQIHRGATGNAGEVMYCPSAGGTWDEMLTGSGLGRYYADASGQADVSAREVGDRAEAGEPAAIAAWRGWGSAVGEAIGIVAAVADPSVVVLGGSLSLRRDLYDEPMMTSLRKRVAPAAAETLAVKTAQLGPGAGVVGAAFHALRSAGLHS